MTFVALSCPQCAAPLPRVAIWRAVKCAACGSLVVRTESVVKRDAFRQALLRARQQDSTAASMECGGARYRLLQELGRGEHCTVHLARRLGPLPQLVTLKWSMARTAEAHFTRETSVLHQLQALGNEVEGAYFSRLLPEVVASGVVTDDASKHALILRHPSGYWGSLAALGDRFPAGLDPRHAVWIWRRILAVLDFIHRHGWRHGDVRPEHALVHPQDHAVRLIGWAAAHDHASQAEHATDLSRSARIVQVLLAGSAGQLPSGVPAGLARLLNRAAEDADFCQGVGAQGLDDLLRAEAKNAYGPPTFVRLIV